jgi:hypothetical protein
MDRGEDWGTSRLSPYFSRISCPRISSGLGFNAGLGFNTGGTGEHGVLLRVSRFRFSVRGGWIGSLPVHSPNLEWDGFLSKGWMSQSADLFSVENLGGGCPVFPTSSEFFGRWTEAGIGVRPVCPRISSYFFWGEERVSIRESRARIQCGAWIQHRGHRGTRGTSESFPVPFQRSGWLDRELCGA